MSGYKDVESLGTTGKVEVLKHNGVVDVNWFDSSEDKWYKISHPVDLARREEDRALVNPVTNETVVTSLADSGFFVVDHVDGTTIYSHEDTSRVDIRIIGEVDD